MTERRSCLATESLAVDLGRRTVLGDMAIEAWPGELLAVVGPNGAGKTTLVRALAGILPYRGSIRLDGTDLAAIPPAVRARKIAYLPQGQAFHWPMRVAEIVALGRLPHGGGASPADRVAVEQAMAECSVTDFADRPVTTLSGGERSRVALARALAVQSDVILADEPTASLDPRYQLTVLQLLKDRANAGKAVVAVLHDIALASRFADRVALIADGRLRAYGSPGRVLSEAQIAETFGVAAVTVERDGVRVAIPWELKSP